jgi:hypothetical protein
MLTKVPFVCISARVVRNYSVLHKNCSGNVDSAPAHSPQHPRHRINSTLIVSSFITVPSSSFQRLSAVTATAPNHTAIPRQDGARLTADAQATYVFVAALCEANQFSFDKLVPWLRSHVTQDPPVGPTLLYSEARRDQPA